MPTIREITAVSVKRSLRWHADNPWSAERYLLAALGELGEAVNAMKKLWRLRENITSVTEPGREIASEDQAREFIGAELADTLLYLVLVAARLGIDLEDQVVRKFNKTSANYGFPERLEQG